MRRIRLFLALAVGIALILLCASALADDPMKVSMELSTNKFTEPKPITVSITVTNVGDGDMPSPVTLYYPNGKKVEEFGSPTLSVGASKNWSGTWNVTQAELEAGRITFKIRYAVYGDEEDEEGNPKLINKAKNFSKKITYVGVDATPEITVNRTITPTTAQKGQEVSVTYEIANVGTVDVTSVNIKENSSISTKSATIDAIKAGESEKYTFTATMGTKDLTSAATVSYKAGGKTYSSRVESATVKYGVVNLSATLTADKKGGAPGDTVKLTLKLKNSGTVDFTDVTVTDPTLGEVFSGLTVKAGETVTLEKELTITETLELQFTVKGNDATETGVETATGRVKIIATNPAEQIVLSVEAEADRTLVYKIPGTVRLKITVHNDSAVAVENISVRAIDTVLYTFESIAAGESAFFLRDVNISMAGTFQFTARCRDQLDQVLSFTSNPIVISYAEPTPVPTEAPLVTPPAPATDTMPPDQPMPEWLDQAEDIAGIAKWVFAGIGGVLVVLLLIGGVRRGRQRSESKKAMDHLDGATYRDYGSQPKGRRRSEISNGGDMKKEEAGESAENTAQSSELMAETLKRLYTEKPGSAESGSAPAEEAQATQRFDPAQITGTETAQPEQPAEPAEQPAEGAAANETEAEGPSGGSRRRRGRK